MHALDELIFKNLTWNDNFNYFHNLFREKEIWHNKVLVPTTHHQEHNADKKIDNNNFDVS